MLIPAGTVTRVWGPTPISSERTTMLVETQLGAARQVGRQLQMAARPAAVDQVTVTTPPDPHQLRDAVTGDLNALFLGLAGISLVIGALGIANTSLVAVLERVGEIGPRRPRARSSAWSPARTRPGGPAESNRPRRCAAEGDPCRKLRPRCPHRTPKVSGSFDRLPIVAGHPRWANAWCMGSCICTGGRPVPLHIPSPSTMDRHEPWPRVPRIAECDVLH